MVIHMYLYTTASIVALPVMYQHHSIVFITFKVVVDYYIHQCMIELYKLERSDFVMYFVYLLIAL